MKKREKLVITATIAASGVSIFLFAWVSLSHFLQNPGKTDVPLISTIHDDKIKQISSIKPQPETTATNNTSNHNEVARKTGSSTSKSQNKATDAQQASSTSGRVIECENSEIVHCVNNLSDQKPPDVTIKTDVKSIYTGVKEAVSSLFSTPQR